MKFPSFLAACAACLSPFAVIAQTAPAKGAAHETSAIAAGGMAAAKSPPPLAGADQNTLSRSEYFSWINNTNEGSTEAQTLANLDFFRWLREAYGMQLDIYAWDAGNLDTSGHGGGYATMKGERFKKAFPRGWRPSAERAAQAGTRLGVWGGPDGYGATPQEEQARRDLLVSLCRDLHFALFKWDAVCGPLRPEKRQAVIQTLEECRKYSPDLIVLNHRLDLGAALPYVTTQLWEGQEMYIDVNMPNDVTATHHRVGAMSRGVTPGLGRLFEDHGVCLSSCMDYWDDELILQAFNRSLILAPEIYGNPWLLKDGEYPKLARIFNLHRRYGSLLVNGMLLPEKEYGPNATSRGDGQTRFITLRNLSWLPVTYHLKLDDSIGLQAKNSIEVRRFHPHEAILGTFPAGKSVDVEVPPFRACLLMATARPDPEIGVRGCDYDILRDLPGKPVALRLLGLPGTAATVQCVSGMRKFTQAVGIAAAFAQGSPTQISFPGKPLLLPWHRKLADLEPVPVPADAQRLYEATCFAADNDALEFASLRRAGPTQIAAVQKARDAFLGQEILKTRGCSSALLFDGDPGTAFASTPDPFRSKNGEEVSPSAQLRIDLGRPTTLDRLSIQLRKGAPGGDAEISDDLKTWTAVPIRTASHVLTLDIPKGKPIRYIRLARGDLEPTEVQGFRGGVALDRKDWKASNLFDSYAARPATDAWQATVTLPEAAPGSYLCIALNGKHGVEGAWCGVRMGDRVLGCPDRATSFPSNVWEATVVRSDSNYTYFLPVTPEMIGKPLDIVAMTLQGGSNTYKPEVWITSENPFVSREVTLR